RHLVGAGTERRNVDEGAPKRGRQSDGVSDSNADLVLLNGAFSSLIEPDHRCRRASHSTRPFAYPKIVCGQPHQGLGDPRLRAFLREPDASFGEGTMIFGVQHAQDDGGRTSFHQLQTTPRVYILLTSFDACVDAHVTHFDLGHKGEKWLGAYRTDDR